MNCHPTFALCQLSFAAYILHSWPLSFLFFQNRLLFATERKVKLSYTYFPKYSFRIGASNAAPKVSNYIFIKNSLCEKTVFYIDKVSIELYLKYSTYQLRASYKREPHLHINIFEKKKGDITQGYMRMTHDIVGFFKSFDPLFQSKIYGLKKLQVRSKQKKNSGCLRKSRLKSVDVKLLWPRRTQTMTCTIRIS